MSNRKKPRNATRKCCEADESNDGSTALLEYIIVQSRHHRRCHRYHHDFVLSWQVYEDQWKDIKDVNLKDIKDVNFS